MSAPDVVVVGGGIGGLASAYALASAGQQVRVLERAAEFGEVGAGLQMAPNATRILRDWGLLDEVVANGVLPRRLVLRDALDGSELTYLDAADLERRYGAPYVVLHRSDLHATLLRGCEQLGVDLVTAAAVQDVEQSETGATAVSEHRSDFASVVVAADGLTSTLRGQLSEDDTINSGYVAYRGTLRIEETASIKGVANDSMVIYIGPGRHFVQYPLRRGEIFNQVAVFRSQRYERGEENWGAPDELDNAFADSCVELQTALPHLWRDRWWQMFDREPIPQWVRGRLALTGDAAHPMLQYLAQGACQALEDASVLGRLSAEHRTGPTTVDWDKALYEYNQVRAARTAEVQRNARAWGDLWHCDGLFRSVRNAFLRDRAVDDYQYIDWLYAS